MRQSVRDQFIPFTNEFEGTCYWMYLDVKGLVTTAIGCLIDNIPSACSLPWRRPDGSLASRDDVIAEWVTVRSHHEMAELGGFSFQRVTRLRLDDDDIQSMVDSILERNESYMKRRYPDWESWPACAQLACLSLAWACGASYQFPNMDRALMNRDFLTASREIEMTPEHNPGNNLDARNRADELLMRNAERVEAYHLDPDMLVWDRLIGIEDADTLPSIQTSASLPTICPEPIDVVSGGRKT